MNKQLLLRILLVDCLLSFVLSAFFQVYEISPCQASGLRANQKGAANVAQVHDKIAVAIGISNFKDGSIPQLRSAHDSALAMAKALKNPSIGRFKYDNIVLLTDNDTDLAHTNELLNNGLTRRALQSDLIFVYLAGRSVLSQDGKKIFVCCTDSKLANIEETGLDLQQTLSTIRRRTQSKYVVCFLDLSLIKGNDQVKDAIPPVAEKRRKAHLDVVQLANDSGVTIFSANDLESESQSNPEGISYFAYYVIENLKFTKGALALSSLAQAVTDHVRKATSCEPASVASTPQAGSTAHAASAQVAGTESTAVRPGHTQSPRFGMAEDSPNIGSLVLGMAITKELPGAFSGVKIGYDYGRLAIDHPELLPGAGIGIPDGPTFTKRSRRPNLAVQRDTDDENSSQTNSPPEINLKPYIKQARKVIHAKWNPPRGFEGKKVIVAFTIVRDGTIEDPQIIEASGTETVDQSALAALKAASPLQPLPAGSVKSVRLRYEFDSSDSSQTVAPADDRTQQ
jgi:TonB family protein